MKNRLSPSILAADFSALQEDVALAEAAGAKSFHFDIMDGHFVPNISYGAGIVSALRNKSKAFFDVHLMVEEPDYFFADTIEEILPICPYILIMSVNPGFGGQSFISYTLDKIKRLRKMAEERNLPLEIGVDGGVKLDNISPILEAGANFIVAGSSVFGKKDEIGERVKSFNKVLENA